MYTRVWGLVGGNLRDRDHLEEPGVDGNHNIKMDLQEVRCRGLDWINLIQFRDRWRTVVNAVMSLRVS